MRPRRFVTANVLLAKPGGNEDTLLFAERLTVDDTDLGPVTAIRSVWEPTDEERAQIAAGANIDLYVMADGQPPMAMLLTDVKLGRPD